MIVALPLAISVGTSHVLRARSGSTVIFWILRGRVRDTWRPPPIVVATATIAEQWTEGAFFAFILLAFSGSCLACRLATIRHVLHLVISDSWGIAILIMTQRPGAAAPCSCWQRSSCRWLAAGLSKAIPPSLGSSWFCQRSRRYGCATRCAGPGLDQQDGRLHRRDPTGHAADFPQVANLTMLQVLLSRGHRAVGIPRFTADVAGHGQHQYPHRSNRTDRPGIATPPGSSAAVRRRPIRTSEMVVRPPCRRHYSVVLFVFAPG